MEARNSVEASKHVLFHLAGKVLRAGEDAEDPHDEFHGEAMERTGFWGDKGAGSLIVARSTGRVLIPFRSRDVLQPHTWGTWGGALDPGLTFERGALREVRQEAGHDIAVELVPIYKFERHEDGELVFAYQNFIALVDDEFEPTLNWETEEARWFEFGDWPAPLHFGLEAVLKDEASVAALREACQPAAPRPGA